MDEERNNDNCVIQVLRTFRNMTSFPIPQLTTFQKLHVMFSCESIRNI